MATRDFGTIYVARDEREARRLFGAPREDGQARLVFSRDELSEALAHHNEPDFNFLDWLACQIEIKRAMPTARCESVRKTATPTAQTGTTFAEAQGEEDDQTRLFGD